MIYPSSAITTVHLEITSRCNAACPMCARNKMGGADNPILPLTELSLEDIKVILPPAFIGQLSSVFMCGNFGDPVAAKDTLRAFEYLRAENSKMHLSMHTNGSARTPEWWARLARIMGRKGVVIFGIDGLSDTNHLYRRGTNFEKIMANAQAFIAAGGRALWDFLLFKHNEHQVDEIKALSERMGFEKINIKRTNRFVHGRTSEVWDKEGRVEYVIEMPSDPPSPPIHTHKPSAIERFGSWDAFLDVAAIRCQTGEEGSVYVSAEGLVFPCCWTASQMYPWFTEPQQSQIWTHIMAVGGKDSIDARKHTLAEIVEGPFFQAIENSWKQPSCAAGRLKVCAQVCGVRD